MNENSCMVVLSGGQDSTTCLFWAKKQFAEVHAVTFDYGQKHVIELQAAKKVGEMAGVKTHEFVELGPILKGTSPLVNKDYQVGQYAGASHLPGGIEPTFVPCRNILFLTLAANRATCLGISDLVTGLCEADYGGYPDCRYGFVVEMEHALSKGIYGNHHSVRIHTPLMSLTKKQTVEMAHGDPQCWEALAYSHTCYLGQYPPNPHNHASILRAKGFHEAKLADPLIQRAKAGKLLPDDFPDDGLVEGTRYALAEPVAAG
jgi:7-cyano-7-deazaguanine synthase